KRISPGSSRPCGTTSSSSWTMGWLASLRRLSPAERRTLILAWALLALAPLLLRVLPLRRLLTVSPCRRRPALAPERVAWLVTVAGAVHRDGRPADPALIGRMARALAHRGPDGESRWVAGPVGLAHRRLAAATPEDKQPFADTDGRVFVWDGRLDQPARFEHAWG